MATTARTPRKPRKTAVVALKPDEKDGLVGLIDLDAQTDEEKAEFERTAPLFRLNGVTYEARTKFSAGESISYTKILRERGIDDAIAYAMTQAIGEDGYKAFVDYPYMSPERASKIFTQVLERLNPSRDQAVA